MVKTPKLYFGDTGLTAWLLRYPDPESLRCGPQSGAFFENLAVLECLKRKASLARNTELFFYRDSNRNEIDLVVEAGPSFTLVAYQTERDAAGGTLQHAESPAVALSELQS